VRAAPARKLAAAATACVGAAAAAVAYLEVGGLPGVLYAAGICLAAFVGAVAIIAGRSEPVLQLDHPVAAPRPTRWRQKSRVIAELEAELAATGLELEEHRRALASLAAQHSRESEVAHRNAHRLEQEIRELEAERDSLLALLTDERGRFEQTLDEL
jgi:flagellar motility protein MotE (MotC chaperone)